MRHTTTYLGYEATFAQWAKDQGWDVTKRGWPDFICRRDGVLMAVEVKGGGQDFVSPDQRDMLSDLVDAGIPTYVWTPTEGLRRWVGRTKNVGPAHSVQLAAENAELRELIQTVIADRDRRAATIIRLHEELREAKRELVRVRRQASRAA